MEPSQRRGRPPFEPPPVEYNTRITFLARMTAGEAMAWVAASQALYPPRFERAVPAAAYALTEVTIVIFDPVRGGGDLTSYLPRNAALLLDSERLDDPLARQP